MGQELTDAIRERKNVNLQRAVNEAKAQMDEHRDVIAGCFLAFAAMMKEDYGVSKDVALKALKLAYEMNAKEDK